MPSISRFPTVNDVYELRSGRFLRIDKVNVGNDTLHCHYVDRSGSPTMHPRKGALTVISFWLMRYGDLVEPSTLDL